MSAITRILRLTNIDTLSNLIHTNELKILKKRQKVAENVNYYFNPNLSIEMNDAKVIITNPKYIVLEFDNVKHHGLLTLLRNTSEKLTMYLRNKDSDLFNHSIYSIHSELENTFTIRCHLPNYKGKYAIQSSMSGQSTMFNVPRISCIINNAVIEIRNVWGQGDKYGFNVELKSVAYDI